jgi:SAM-dependent methyltransferase
MGRLLITSLICICLLTGMFGLRFALRAALPRLAWIRSPKNLRERVMVRYQGKNFDAWMFAWFKTGLDAMFHELPDFVRSMPTIRTFLDLGCGYGLAGCLLLEVLEGSTAYAVDPNPKRVAGTAAAMEERGHVFVAAAPDFEQPDFPPKFDAVFALDMIHFLNDQQLNLTLTRLRSRLNEGSFLIIRSPVAPVGPPSFRMQIYSRYAKFKQTFILFRSIEDIRQLIRQSGFELSLSSQSGKNPELHWFIATAAPPDLQSR